MIRVNLLPQKREMSRRSSSSSEGGQLWLGIIGLVLVLEIIGLLLFQNSKQDELLVTQKKNQEIQSKIEDIKRQMANHADIKSQLQNLRAREDAIQKLQSARSGPTATLLELSHMLTPGRGPTVADKDKLEQLRRDNPTAVFNPNWDPRRLWLTSYVENDRVVRMSGLARDGEDVSELLRRISLSDYFFDVRLMPASKTVDTVSKLEVIRFDVQARVRY